MKKKLAIITTHPIQYNAPLFRSLTERNNITIKVFYTWGKSVLAGKYDPGFGKVVEWDIPLLDGYDWLFPENVSPRPGSDHFKGIDNPGIVRELEAWGADALLVYGWNFKSHLKVLRHFKNRVPVFFRGDSTLLDDQPGLKLLLRKVALGWIYRHVDKAFYPGVNSRDYFIQAGLKDDQMILAPHAINNDFFQDPDGSSQRRAEQWRRELGIPEGAIVFLFAGKLEPKKSPLLLMEAFYSAGLPANAHLVFVGNGLLEKELKDGVRDQRVHFINFQNQSLMPVIYRLGDVFVLPSGGPGETWGLAINEAMVCGRPVIASSKCGGAPDLIRNGYNGYIFTAGEMSELQDKIKQLFQNKGQLAEMGRNAALHIRDFSITRIAEAIEQAVINTGSR